MVVAMVGVLAALAVVGYRKYLNQAQSSEAISIITGIRAGQEAYRAEMLTYLSCSSSLTDFYPNPNPNDSRWNWVRPGDSRYADTSKGWRLLNVQPDAPVRFGYAVVAGVGPTPPAVPSDTSGIAGFMRPPTWPTVTSGTPWYVVVAKNRRTVAGRASWFVSSSLGGETYGENEGE